jgi:hypothetical protein
MAFSISGAISVGAAVAGAVGAFKGAEAASDAAEAQSAAVALQRRQQAITSARQRREAIRERRIAVASNQARGAAQGMSGSSSLAGIQGALNTNLASNLNFLDVSTTLTGARASFLDQASSLQARGNNFLAASKLGFTIAGKSFGMFRQTEAGRNLIAKL